MGIASFSFGVIADAQYCDYDPVGTRYYRHSLAKLNDAVETFNRRDLTFTVQLGDLIDRDLSSFVDVLPIFYQLKGPKYHVLGNHDFPVSTDKVAEILRMRNQYYDFGIAGWRFVVLDANDISLYANAPGSEKHQQARSIYDELRNKGKGNAQTWNSGVGPEQIVWLGEVLKKASAAGERVILFCHSPVAPDNVHNLWNDTEVLQLLASTPNVMACLSGHNHAGNYAVHHGIHFVTFQGMVETADNNAFAIVHVYADHLEVEGFGREPDRTLHLRKAGTQQLLSR